MATLYDGIPVFAPAAGATALASDQVTLQAKLILGLAARWRPLSLASAQVGDAAGWTLAWTLGANPDLVWSDVATSSSELIVPVSLRDGEYITQATAFVHSTAGNPTAGSIVLYEQRMANGGVNSITTFGCAGNFWDTDGVVTQYTDAAVNYQTTDTDFYFVGIIAATGGMAGVTSTLYGLALETRFHEGV